MPLQRRLPKWGFRPLTHIVYRPINLSTLQQLADDKGYQKIGREELIASGLIGKKHLVKILANGALTSALTVEANAFSQAAQQAIEAAGGQITKI